MSLRWEDVEWNWNGGINGAVRASRNLGLKNESPERSDWTMSAMLSGVALPSMLELYLKRGECWSSVFRCRLVMFASEQ